MDRAARPLLADPPGCALFKQADFAAAWMPRGTTIGADGDVAWFLLPGDTTSTQAPVLVGGDEIVQFHHLMAYLAGPDAGTSWARRGGYLSPKSSIPDDVYPSDYLGELVTVLRKAPTLAFDASDQMPPDVGSGLLWTSITDWVAGAVDCPTFARRIDRARRADAASPTSRAPSARATARPRRPRVRPRRLPHRPAPRPSRAGDASTR